ncbi:hypothetical protein B0J13DRAFT_557022 [Dactylonectria estremocensis]|uniref:Uncharacterized protein n=1 Tax=Dactylonectria estremocensis TaxID=1079267 RepID=A0A9P9EPG8_9HYPO|nr:hypothetical protein B0J13DRAFT_557022 [Dactylonectria estremocensis]
MMGSCKVPNLLWISLGVLLYLLTRLNNNAQLWPVRHVRLGRVRSRHWLLNAFTEITRKLVPGRFQPIAALIRSNPRLRSIRWPIEWAHIRFDANRTGWW